jgi:hypothetical protein
MFRLPKSSEGGFASGLGTSPQQGDLQVNAVPGHICRWQQGWVPSAGAC